MTTLHGYDVSGWQDDNDVRAAKNLDFLIVKASEGLTYSDHMHAAHVAAARARKALVGHYHFAHIDTSAQAQADYFLTQAKPAKGDVVVLDFEPYGQNGSPRSYAPWIIAFADRVRERVGVDPWLYMDDNLLSVLDGAATPAQLKRIREMPLWKASYKTAPGNLHGWPRLTAWQFTDKPLDSDYFYGSADDWRALAIGGSGGGHAPHKVSAEIQSYLNRTVKAGLVVDGIFGPLTKKALNDYLVNKHGAFTGQAFLVKAIQSYLNSFGFITPKLVVDGICGPMTKAAILLYVNGHNGGFTNATF